MLPCWYHALAAGLWLLDTDCATLKTRKLGAGRLEWPIDQPHLLLDEICEPDGAVMKVTPVPLTPPPLVLPMLPGAQSSRATVEVAAPTTLACWLGGETPNGS